MTRRSQRLSSGSKPTPQSTHKRAASNTAIQAVEAKRSKMKRATPTKSQFFQKSADPIESDGDEQEDAEESSNSDEETSEFGKESEELSSSEEEVDDYGNDSDEPPKPRKKTKTGKGSNSPTTVRTKGGELWRPGVKTGLGPGNQVVIKKPQARPAGKTPYQDETIHPNTLLFLKDLKANNERQWLKMHDAEFRQAERDWHSFVAKLTERLIEIDDTVPELPVKDVIFRIYRDVRFTSDPTPYKPHFSAAWSRTGRKGPYAHYYVQISPNNKSFVGGGLWHPEAAPVAAMRQDIDRHPHRIKEVLLDESMRKEFFGGISKQEGKAVKTFVSKNSDNALKTKPKGYDGEHPEIELLRLRNYTIGCNLTEDEVLGETSLERVAHLLSCMKPFITYLNSVVMPDEESSNESGEPSADDDDEGSN